MKANPHASSSAPYPQELKELQNEINCMNDSRDFQDAESVRSGHSHVTSQVSFPPHPIPEGMLSRSLGMPSRREGPPSIWDTHGISGNVFVNPDASSSAPYPQELHQWNSSSEEPLHSSTVEKSERPEQNQDLRCQSGPSAKDSVMKVFQLIRDAPASSSRELLLEPRAKVVSGEHSIFLTFRRTEIAISA